MPLVSLQSLLITNAAFCSLHGGGLTGAVTAEFLNYFYQIVFLLLGHDVRTVSVLSWTTSSSRLAKIPFLRQHPGQARRYSLSERARARTVVAGARSCLGPGVTSSRGYVSVCPCVRPAHTIFPRSRLLFP